MNTKEYEEIKEKLDQLKSKKTKAEGALEPLESQLKKEFSVTTVEAAKEKKEEIHREIEEDKARQDKLCKQLDDLADWEEL
jgi:chromosome segregation ATPase